MTATFLVLYLVAMLLLGALAARKVDRPESYLVAGRTGGALLVGGSLTATILGASATLGMARQAYEHGLTAAWFLLAGVVGLLLLAGLFAGPCRRLGVYTVPEILDHHYGPTARQAATLVIAVAWLGVIAAQFTAAGRLLGHAVGGDGTVWIVAAAAVLILYTTLGGQLSILWTDLGQVGLLLVGLVAVAVTACSRAAALGWPVPPEHLAFPFSSSFGPAQTGNWLVTIGLTYVAGPDMISRLLCARDEVTARCAAAGAALVLAPTAFVIAAIGVAAKALLPGIPPGQALLAVSDTCLPPWAAGLLCAALLAAVMSSADTCLLTAATMLAVDLKPAPEAAVLPRTRALVVLVGLASLGIALRLDAILETLLFAYAVYTCGIALPLLCGFARERLQLTSQGAVAAMLGGGGLAAAGKVLGANPDRLTWSALTLSLALLLLVSRLRRSEPGLEEDSCGTDT